MKDLLGWFIERIGERREERTPTPDDLTPEDIKTVLGEFGAMWTPGLIFSERWEFEHNDLDYPYVYEAEVMPESLDKLSVQVSLVDNGTVDVGVGLVSRLRQRLGHFGANRSPVLLTGMQLQELSREDLRLIIALVGAGRFSALSRSVWKFPLSETMVADMDVHGLLARAGLANSWMNLTFMDDPAGSPGVLGEIVHYRPWNDGG